MLEKSTIIISNGSWVALEMRLLATAGWFVALYADRYVRLSHAVTLLAYSVCISFALHSGCTLGL